MRLGEFGHVRRVADFAAREARPLGGGVRDHLAHEHATVHVAAHVLSQFGRRVVAAQSIVVVHSELGSAPAVARALDRLEHPRIVGTIAGDDTCLVVAANNRDAALLARELGDLVG